MFATAGIEASTAQPEKIDYRVVHEIVGRIRIRIPRLAVDPAYAAKLQQSVKSINSVTSVRINPLASSIVVQYRASAVSNAIQEHLFACIQQAVHVGEPAKFTPPTQPAFKLENDEVVLAESSNSDASSGESTAEKELVSQPESVPLSTSAEAITPAVTSAVTEELLIPDLLLTPDEAVPITAIAEASVSLPETLPLTSEETVLPAALIEEPVSLPETLPLTSEETVLPAALIEEPVSLPETLPSTSEETVLPAALIEEPVDLSQLQLDAFVVSSDAIGEEQATTDTPPLAASTEATTSAVKTNPSPVKLRLNQNDLAERLGVATQALTHQRTKPKFNDWSKARDPEGRAWVYASATKSYHTDERKARKSQQSDAASDKNGKAGEEL